jgi:predicted RNA-binding Zn ribbon-like protein
MDRTAHNLELVGGQLCLDFANTMSTRIEALRHDYLSTYAELVAWSRHVQILTDNEAEVLLRSADRRPKPAADALSRAIGLREMIYRVFSAVAEQREPETSDLAALNTTLHEALPRLEIVPSAGRFDWTWVVENDELDRVLWPIVGSAAELLTSGDLGRVRQCAREGCDWLFLDLSKNQSRRWCSMNMCGSRVKSRRYYRRKKRQVR